MDLPSIKANPFTSREKSRTFKPGRVCGYEGCDVLLSTYNPSRICGNHGRSAFQTSPGKKGKNDTKVAASVLAAAAKKSKKRTKAKR